MSPNVVAKVSRPQLSAFIVETIGLNFPPERQTDLERGLLGAAKEFGFEDADECADWLLTTPQTRAQLQVLASHLTVGETYFFREKKTFEVLTGTVLPELIRARRATGRRLRIWSAACCTGEEPYSLAMLLHQTIPDLADWQVTILATDINGRFLKKAAEGVYGEWSFREAQPGIKERYFQRTADGHYAIVPEIRKQVTFAHLNLVEDIYPALATETNAMDLIFCRNVLMYFAHPQAQKVVQKLRHALLEDGWLVVSPTDGSQALFSGFAPVNFPGVILYQKGPVKERTLPPWTPSLPAEPLTPTPWNPPMLPVAEIVKTDAPPPPETVAAELYQQGRFEEASDHLLASLAGKTEPVTETFSLLARALANQGKLIEALAWCDRWVAADKLDHAGHYLRAVIQQELGNQAQARLSLQRAIYLQPDFVLAHFALGNLARNNGKEDEAAKHFANVSHLLERCRPEDLLPESDGLTAGRLAEIITSNTTMEGAS